MVSSQLNSDVPKNHHKAAHYQSDDHAPAPVDILIIELHEQCRIRPRSVQNTYVPEIPREDTRRALVHLSGLLLI